jgi:ribosome-binding factor A
MPREFGRNRRVADRIQRELAGLMQRELPHAELGFVTVSAVEVSPDLKQARVYVTSFGAAVQGSSNERLAALLNEQAGHYRSHLAHALTMRSVPKLQFVADASIERGDRLSELIDSLKADGRGR